MQKYQGDISLIKGIEVPKDLKLKPIPLGGLVVALGEVTNHKHIIKPVDVMTKISYAEYLNEHFVIVRGGNAKIVHEEHKTITLEPGTYFVGKQFEYDELEEFRQVRD